MPCRVISTCLCVASGDKKASLGSLCRLFTGIYEDYQLVDYHRDQQYEVLPSVAVAYSVLLTGRSEVRVLDARSWKYFPKRTVELRQQTPLALLAPARRARQLQP